MPACEHARLAIRSTLESAYRPGAARGGRVARRTSSVSFLLSRRFDDRREARTELALSSARFDPATTGPHGLAISNLVVRLLSEYTGRGATQARTHFNDDLVTVVVQDLMTKGEHSLIRDGQGELVLETRRAYQVAMREELPPASRRSPGARWSPSSAPTTSIPTSRSRASCSRRRTADARRRRQRGGGVAHRGDERLRRGARGVGGARRGEDRAIDRALGDRAQRDAAAPALERAARAAASPPARGRRARG